MHTIVQEGVPLIDWGTPTHQYHIKSNWSLSLDHHQLLIFFEKMALESLRKNKKSSKADKEDS